MVAMNEKLQVKIKLDIRSKLSTLSKKMLQGNISKIFLTPEIASF